MLHEDYFIQNKQNTDSEQSENALSCSGSGAALLFVPFVSVRIQHTCVFFHVHAAQYVFIEVAAEHLLNIWAIETPVLPGCTEHRGAVQCFLRHSGNSCRRRRTASAPSAARYHSDMPELTHTHTQAQIRVVQSLDLSSVRVVELILCVWVCVCHLVDFLPPVLVCDPCNHGINGINN